MKRFIEVLVGRESNEERLETRMDKGFCVRRAHFVPRFVPRFSFRWIQRASRAGFAGKYRVLCTLSNRAISLRSGCAPLADLRGTPEVPQLHSGDSNPDESEKSDKPEEPPAAMQTPAAESFPPVPPAEQFQPISTTASAAFTTTNQNGDGEYHEPVQTGDAFQGFNAALASFATLSGFDGSHIVADEELPLGYRVIFPDVQIGIEDLGEGSLALDGLMFLATLSGQEVDFEYFDLGAIRRVLIEEELAEAAQRLVAEMRGVL